MRSGQPPPGRGKPGIVDRDPDRLTVLWVGGAVEGGRQPAREAIGRPLGCRLIATLQIPPTEEKGGSDHGPAASGATRLIKP
ncbi:hypothetical protein V5E97_04680 [Singulisphaera sp. Ch08]|uniref:Uncharacterized protein n=1 Tax=Singulisphaera sp. Ch08 TaxID=3120278 RepID=A0AAU7CIM8_9BACT